MGFNLFPLFSLIKYFPYNNPTQPLCLLSIFHTLNYYIIHTLYRGKSSDIYTYTIIITNNTILILSKPTNTYTTKNYTLYKHHYFPILYKKKSLYGTILKSFNLKLYLIKKGVKNLLLNINSICNVKLLPTNY